MITPTNPPRFGTTTFQTTPAFAKGAAVLAKYADSSRTWKKATVMDVKESGSIVTVRFDGYADMTDLPVTRVRAATAKHETKSTEKKDRRPREPRQPTRKPLQPATQLPKATNACEQALCTVRSCLSKLAPDNFDKIAAQVVAAKVETATALSAIVDLMFERAIAETHFTEIYARLFAWCAEQMPSFDDTQSNTALTFRKLLLNKTQLEFESASVERKRKLGLALFVGQLWLHGLLRDQIVYGCVSAVIRAAEEGRVEGGALQTDAVEIACTLLQTIGQRCDASAEGRARTHAWMAQLAGWTADKAKLPAARVRFKVMDVLDARKQGWKKSVTAK